MSISGCVTSTRIEFEMDLSLVNRTLILVEVSVSIYSPTLQGQMEKHVNVTVALLMTTTARIKKTWIFAR
jgi:hypothetical protein